MIARKSGTGRPHLKTDTDVLEDDEDALIDDKPDDGFAALDDEDDAKPDDRRRDPLRRPV